MTFSRGQASPLSSRLFAISMSAGLAAASCSAGQSAASGVAGTVSASQQALYRQMDALRDFSCKSLHAGMSNGDSRARTEEIATQWLAIDQSVAAEREKDRATRSDRPHPSIVLSSYWTQWQHALNSGQSCFDESALSPRDADGAFLRAGGSGNWIVVRKTGDQPTAVPDNIIAACSTPERNPERGFDQCALAIVSADAARK
jgi:hypothetical protein